MTKNDSKQMTMFEAARIALTFEEGDEIQIEAQDAFFHMVEGELTDFQHETLSTYCDGATVPEMVIEGLRLVFMNRFGDEPAMVLDRTPLYLREFPDFTLNLPIPAGFRDTSWHNDACPSWTHETLKLKLWINYEDPDRRELDSFYMLTDDEGLSLVDVQTNSWDHVAKQILIHRVAHAFTSMMTEGVPPDVLDKLKQGHIVFGDLGIDCNPIMEQALEQNGVKVFCDQGHIHDEVKHLWGLAYAVALSFYLPLVGSINGEVQA